MIEDALLAFLCAGFMSAKPLVHLLESWLAKIPQGFNEIGIKDNKFNTGDRPSESRYPLLDDVRPV